MRTTVFAISTAILALAATSAGAASIDLSGKVEAHGVKPSWSLEVAGGTRLTLTRPGKPPVHATAPGAAITVNGASSGASWTAKAADGQVVKASLQSGACKLGTETYPMTAQVTVGSETLSGCGRTH